MSDHATEGLPARLRAWRIVAIVLMSKDAEALARFYREAFDFVDEKVAAEEVPDGCLHLMLGDTRLWIEPAGPDAAPYPGDVPGWSQLFQHFAIRVANMDAAMARLERIKGWQAISTDGPQTLPADTGGVTAFKFRDPEGHPLEFLAFPDRTSGRLFAAIDHTAISVVDIERSIAFYETLGLTVAGRTLNRGIEQDRLDGIVEAKVDVVGMRTPAGKAPHLELLGYRERPADGGATHAERGDIVATLTLFAAEQTSANNGFRSRTALQDPNLHHLAIEH
ncbi:MAG: VOC family protein [Burkholderiaceae bacterium]